MSLFHSHPYFANDHTDEPTALGFALFLMPAAAKHNTCYYLSAAGPPAALRSIWASLVKNNGASLYCSHWADRKFILGAAPIKNAIKGFRRTNIGHLLAYTRTPGLIVITDPAAAKLIQPEDEPTRQALRTAALPLAYARLEAWLQEHSVLPVRPGWGETLWPHLTDPTLLAQHIAAINQSLKPNEKSFPDDTTPLTPLAAFGDCLAAWLVNPDFPWQPLASHLLGTGLLSF